MASAQDISAVTELLGRRPQGEFSVVVRDSDGQPAVIRNAAWLDSGRPMPTTFWLVHKDLNRWIGSLEASGGVNQAERDIGMDVIAADHARYRLVRDAIALADPAPSGEHSPSGGVGGTRIGVKCLHAHLRGG